MTATCKAFLTASTCIKAFSSMYLQMNSQRLFHCKSFLTDCTHVRPWLVIKWMLSDIITTSFNVITCIIHTTCTYTHRQAGGFLRPDCAPSLESQQFRMLPVLNVRRASIAARRCCCCTLLPASAHHSIDGGELPEWQTSKCISSVSFVRIELNLFTIHRRHRRKK